MTTKDTKNIPSLAAEQAIKVQADLPKHVQLVVVSKTQPIPNITPLYDAGFRHFGENRADDLRHKYEQMPKDIQWHMIGHLQTNKVPIISPFVHLIHSVDSHKLLLKINQAGSACQRRINVLLQVKISPDDTKYGLSEAALQAIIEDEKVAELRYIRIIGLMGMASLTQDATQTQREFNQLNKLFETYKSRPHPTITMQVLSMGMSGDYPIALQQGSNMVRVGSAIFAPPV